MINPVRISTWVKKLPNTSLKCPPTSHNSLDNHSQSSPPATSKLPFLELPKPTSSSELISNTNGFELSIETLSIDSQKFRGNPQKKRTEHTIYLEQKTNSV